MATNNDRKIWQERANKLKRKRTGNQNAVKDDKVGAIGCHILDEKEMIVQRLSSVATGKAMKFNKMGSQEFVAYPYDELTIENLIQACTVHFRDILLDNQKCDILQSQDGPSCTKLSHIKDFKKIYVRFITNTNANHASISIGKYFDKMPRRSPTTTRTSQNQNLFSKHLSTPSKSSWTIPKKQNHSQSQFPKSLSISNMLQFGTAITKTATPPVVIELQEIDISAMKWSYPTANKFSISESPLSKGGFREVYEATNIETKKKFVIKTFLPDVIATMEKVNSIIAIKENEDSLSKKAIQAHALAKNVTKSLKKLCFQKELMFEFGEFFTYNNAFLGSKVMPDGGRQTVMVEEYVEGEFLKFINNDGTIIHGQVKDLERLLKAECLAHYSFFKSGERFMIVDIQGSGFTLYDPEIATTDNAIENDRLNFNLGNLSKEAINLFMSAHSCNRFCKLIGLEPVVVSSKLSENSKR